RSALTRNTAELVRRYQRKKALYLAQNVAANREEKIRREADQAERVLLSSPKRKRSRVRGYAPVGDHPVFEAGSAVTRTELLRAREAERGAADIARALEVLDQGDLIEQALDSLGDLFEGPRATGLTDPAADNLPEDPHAAAVRRARLEKRRRSEDIGTQPS